MVRRSLEPVLWLLFSAGGVVSALTLPVLVLLLGIAFPLGWLTAPTYEHLAAVVRHPVTRLALFGICVLSLVHAAHRFRFTLYDGLQYIAFHASASGTGIRVIGSLGAATTDSDIFLLNVDDALAGVGTRINLTNNPDAIDDDPDWSPDGSRIAFTSHAVNDPNHNNAVSAELYVMNADGTGTPTRLTFNGEEERAPAWSPDGARIAYSCRTGGLDFDICVLTFNEDGSTTIQQLTDNTIPELTVSWSRDGQTLLFHRNAVSGTVDQLFTMKADGSEAPIQHTSEPGVSVLAKWGMLRVKQN